MQRHPDAHHARRQVEWITEACAIADTQDDPAARYWAHSNGGNVAIQCADGDAFAHHDAVREEESQRIPHAIIQWNRVWRQALAAILRGELDEAERLNDAAFAFGSEHGQVDAFQMYGAQLMNIRDHQGRMDEMVPLLEQAVIDTPGMPVYRAVLAHCCVDAGQDADAQRLLDDDLACAFEMRMDLNWTTAQANWAIAAALGTALRGRTPRKLSPYHDQIVFTGASGERVARPPSRPARPHTRTPRRRPTAWFAESMDLHERLRSPLFIACTQAAWPPSHRPQPKAAMTASSAARHADRPSRPRRRAATAPSSTPRGAGNSE